ncbi:MAG: hypothetical protein AAF846_03825 [Chloroflexota bacterium]
MRYTRSLLFVAVAMLSMFLVACGTSGDGGGNNAESVNLSQTLTYDDEMGATVTVSYPEGWFSESADGTASFASTEDLLTQAGGVDTPEVPSGEVVAIMLALPSEMVSFFVEDGADPSAVAIANSFVSDIIDTEGEIGEVEETTIGEQSAAVVQGTTEGVDVVLVTIDLGDGNYALVFGATAEGEGNDIRATIEAMAGSIEYTVASDE